MHCNGVNGFDIKNYPLLKLALPLVAGIVTGWLCSVDVLHTATLFVVSLLLLAAGMLSPAPRWLFGAGAVGVMLSVGIFVITCDKEAENAPIASELAKLAFAYTTSGNSKVTVVIGKAYGAAYTLMGSKSVGADIAFALENACISILPPEAAVAFAWNDKVTADKSREDLEKEWKEKCASPVAAAEIGEIDDIIENAELRQRICAALGMLFSKTDVAPTRRHANMPL